MKKMILPALLAALALGSAAQAEARRDLPAFEMLDTENIGTVTQEQFASLLQALQDRMVARLMEQANEDGMLDEAALRAGLEGMWPQGRAGARMFSRIDSNGDGVIDAEEYAAFRDRMPDRAERRGKSRGRD